MKTSMTRMAIFLIFLAGGVTTVFSQNITGTALTWKASQVTDGRTSATKTSSTEFVTHATSSVDWIQRNGAVKTTFRVVGMEGNWPNIKERGSVTYLLEYEKRSCKMRIERNASGLSLFMDFVDEGAATTRLTFRIDSVSQ